MISCPLRISPERTIEKELDILLQKGFTRLIINGEAYFVEDLMGGETLPEGDMEILIDRAVVRKEDEDNQFRIADSVQTAFFEGHGDCVILVPVKERKVFTDRFELDGIVFELPSVNFFSFNNPYGACRTCEGFGSVLGLDPDLVIPDKSLSVYEGAVAPWRGESSRKWLNELIKNGIQFDFPIHRPYEDLNDEQKELLWTGNKYFKGLNDFFKFVESKMHKIQYRVMLSRFRGRRVCPDCKGTRLRKDAAYVKVDNHSIIDIVLMPIEKSLAFFKNIRLDEMERSEERRVGKE